MSTTLIQESEQGSEELTAEAICRNYGDHVRNLAKRMVSNDSDAEDVTQDVLLQVVRKLRTFRGDSSFSTWLHRVTVNAALAHRRKRAVREEHFITGAETDLLEEGQKPRFDRLVPDQPDEQLFDRELQLLIHNAIADLPEIYREVFVLSELEQLPNADIAERLNLSLPAVKSRLHRARQALRERLAPHVN